MSLLAPAKLNLALYVGRELRADGRHELSSLFCPLELADRIVVGDAAGDADELECPGVEGPNLATVALRGLRARGWSRPPVRIEIDKRIPVAAGLGGGSADAAAVIRLAGDEVAGVEELAAAIGADVPSQIEPEFALVGGAGERITPLPPPGEFAVVLIPDDDGLRAGDVYAEADRLGQRARRRRAGGARRPAARGGGRRRLAARVRRSGRQRPRAGGDLAAPGDRRGALGAGGGRSPQGARHRVGADGIRALRRPRRGRPGGGAATAPLRERDRDDAAAGGGVKLGRLERAPAAAV